MGGETWQLIEPVDGFHTNQIANALIADTWWELLEGTSWLSPVNPFNDQITKIFGNQGGY
jgi:acyloxyacyl hydrolase